jgi:hypothetical protein
MHPTRIKLTCIFSTQFNVSAVSIKRKSNTGPRSLLLFTIIFTTTTADGVAVVSYSSRFTRHIRSGMISVFPLFWASLSNYIDLSD